MSVQNPMELISNSELHYSSPDSAAVVAIKWVVLRTAVQKSSFPNVYFFCLYNYAAFSVSTAPLTDAKLSFMTPGTQIWLAPDAVCSTAECTSHG